MKRLIVLSILLITTLCTSAQEADPNRELFDQANTAYQAGEFQHALELYLSIDEDYQNFAYEFNLGNTYYKLDSLGKAILHYERAKVFDPRQEDLKVNLQLANQQVVDKIESLPSLGVQDLWTNITAIRTLPTWTWLSLISVFITFGSFIVVVVSRSAQIKRVFILTGVLFMIAWIVTYRLPGR